MKALGKGSIASIVEVGLTIVWILLWVGLGLLLLAAIGYGVLHAMIASGWVRQHDPLGRGRPSPGGRRKRRL